MIETENNTSYPSVSGWMIETTILGEMNNQMGSFTRTVNHNPVIIALAKGSVGLSVCLFISEEQYSKCYEQIIIKF